MRVHLSNFLSVLLCVVLLSSASILNAVNDPVEKKYEFTSYSDMMLQEDNAIQSIDDAFKNIEVVISDNNLSYDEFVANYPDQASEVMLQRGDLINSTYASDAPLGIPGFLWGFCLGWVGILLVYLLMDDSPNRSAQVRSAVWGCATVGILVLLYYVFIILVFGSTYGGWWGW